MKNVQEKAHFIAVESGAIVATSWLVWNHVIWILIWAQLPGLGRESTLSPRRHTWLVAPLSLSWQEPLYTCGERVGGNGQKYKEGEHQISFACLEPKWRQGGTMRKWSRAGGFKSASLRLPGPQLAQVSLLFWAWDALSVRQKVCHGWLSWFFPAWKFITPAAYY